LILSIASIGVVAPRPTPSLALDALVDARAYPKSFRNMTTRNDGQKSICGKKVPTWRFVFVVERGDVMRGM